MKLHIDLGSNQLIKAPGVISPLASITVKRGDQPTFELYFYSDGFTPTRLPTGTAIVFAAKATGQYDSTDVAVFADTWTAPADGAFAYTASPSFATTELDTLLNRDSETDNDLASITLMAEISWVAGTKPSSTQTFALVVHNDVYRGGEASPTPATPTYPPPSALITRSDIASLNLGGSGSGSGVTFPKDALATGTIIPSYFDLRKVEWSPAALIGYDNYNNSLYASLDDGQSFTQVLNNHTNNFAMNGLIGVAGGENYSHHSTDGGLTWTSYSIPSIAGFNPGGARGFAFSPDGVCISASYPRAIHKLTAPGEWTPITGLPGTSNLAGVIYFDSAWWFLTVDGSIHRTTDFSTWTTTQVIANSIEYEDLTPMLVINGGTRLILAGYSDRTYYLDAGSSTWVASAPYYTTTNISPRQEVYALSEFEGKIVATGEYGFVATSSDGGATWKHEAIGAFGSASANYDSIDLYGMFKARSGWYYRMLGRLIFVEIRAQAEVEPSELPLGRVSVIHALPETFFAKCIAYDTVLGGFMVAGSLGGHAHMRHTFDFRTWREIPTTNNNPINAMTLVGDHAYFAADGGILYMSSSSRTYPSLGSSTPGKYWTGIVGFNPPRQQDGYGCVGFVVYGLDSEGYAIAAIKSPDGSLVNIDLGENPPYRITAAVWAPAGITLFGSYGITYKSTGEHNGAGTYTWTRSVVKFGNYLDDVECAQHVPGLGYYLTMDDGYLQHSKDGIAWSPLSSNYGSADSAVGIHATRDSIFLASNDNSPSALLALDTSRYYYNEWAVLNQVPEVIAGRGSLSILGMAADPNGDRIAMLLNYPYDNHSSYPCEYIQVVHRNRVDPEQIAGLTGIGVNSLVPYSPTNAAAGLVTYPTALPTYVPDVESTAYTAVTISDPTADAAPLSGGNALRAAYENLRADHEATAALMGITLTGYTPDVEATAYTGYSSGTLFKAELNALRAAYENLRVSHETLRADYSTDLPDYTSNPQSSAYGGSSWWSEIATATTLNALRVAYENLRADHEALRAYFLTVLEAEADSDLTGALPAYTADAEATPYVGATDGEAKLDDLNALRVAYENLRSDHEGLRTALAETRQTCAHLRTSYIAASAALIGARTSVEDLRTKLIATGIFTA